MDPGADQALDSNDRFIGVAEIANLPILAMPEYKAAADDLYQIAQKLLVANENMSRWLNRFLYFDFRAPDAGGGSSSSCGSTAPPKAGSGFRDMKFSCGDVSIIYDRNIAGKLAEMFPHDQKTVEEARRVFVDLGNADQEIAFIYDTVVGTSTTSSRTPSATWTARTSTAPRRGGSSSRSPQPSCPSAWSCSPPGYPTWSCSTLASLVGQ